MERLGKTGFLVLATVIFWAAVALVTVISDEALMQGGTILLAMLATVSIWAMWALDQYGISVDGAPTRDERREYDRAYEKRRKAPSFSYGDIRRNSII